MPIRTEDQARTDLARHLGPLDDLFEAAHAEFRRERRGVAPAMGLGTRASLYRDLIWKHARAYADESKNGAHLHRKSQLFLLGLGGKYLCRVKKLKRGFSVAVSRTPAAADYDANRLPDYASDIFPGCDEATLLYLGWMVPENAPDQIARYLVCNREDCSVLWAIPLGEGSTSPSAQETLPLVDGPGDAPARVTIRKDVAKKAHG